MGQPWMAQGAPLVSGVNEYYCVFATGGSQQKSHTPQARERGCVPADFWLVKKTKEKGVSDR